MLHLFVGARLATHVFSLGADASWSGSTGQETDSGLSFSYPLQEAESAYLFCSRFSVPTGYRGYPSGTESGPDGEAVFETSGVTSSDGYPWGGITMSGVPCVED